MATYQNNFGPGAIDTNAFDESFLSTVLFYAPLGATLSEDGKTMFYDFGFQSGFALGSEAGFSAPWTGTINSLTFVDNGNVVAIGDGFAADAAALLTAIDNGDTAAINALLWNGKDTLLGGASDDTLLGFGGSDVIDGGWGDDRLSGGTGNDRVIGGSGDDNLFGGDGADRLYGGTGLDVIVGGAGNDIIYGGLGSDAVSGGAGADQFKFYRLADIGSDQLDIITDFSHTDGDKIDLSRIDANTAVGGDQAFTFYDNTSGADTPRAAGNLIIGSTSEAGLYSVSLDVSGTGDTAVFFVHSSTGVLTADDFVL